MDMPIAHHPDIQFAPFDILLDEGAGPDARVDEGDALLEFVVILDKLPEDARRIATERVKWSRTYQDKYGIRSGEARNLPEGKAEEIQHLAKRVYRALGLSGYARIDVRMDAEGHVYVLEANPNPQIAHDEDFSDSAEKAGYTYQELLQELLNIGLRRRPANSAPKKPSPAPT